MSFHRTMAKPAGFRPNSPGPLVEPHFCEMRIIRPAGLTACWFADANQRLGFRLAVNHFVRWHRPMNHIGLTTFRVDCLASRETERVLFEYPLL
jgi:hypothetical protein